MGVSTDRGGWLLSGNPQRFDVPALLADEPQPTLLEWSVQPGPRARRMTEGQRIFLWLSGKHAGLWGAGHITGPVQPGSPRTHRQYWANEAQLAKTKAFVPIDLQVWATPISLETVRAFPGLAELAILRQPFGANPFEVTPEQLTALEELLALPADPPATGYGAGFGTAELNRRVELAAMAAVTEEYERRGARVVDVSAHRRGWDLDCHFADETHHVEVKGVRGMQRQFLLTRNELRKAEHQANWWLAVVTEALTNPTMTIEPGDRIVALAEPIQYPVRLP
ncbi:protein NO VEIN domain-containing protein [Crossiella sp. NPDC003009]